MKNLTDKWGPFALFISANIAVGSRHIVSVIQEVNAKSEVLTSAVFKDNQGLRLANLRDFFLWLERPGIILTKIEVSKRLRLMKTKLYLYYLVASPSIPDYKVHASISMLEYATSRTTVCLYGPCDMPLASPSHPLLRNDLTVDHGEPDPGVGVRHKAGRDILPPQNREREAQDGMHLPGLAPHEGHALLVASQVP